MPAEIGRQQTPEEAELLRKRGELAAVRAELAERELELADLRTQLRSFEGRYLREVAVLYAELDEWEARIAELEASLNGSPDSRQQAEGARQRADDTREATHGGALEARDFKPSADMKNLFRDIAKRIHPDFAKDDADRHRRTRLMAQANQAYGEGDAEALRCILDDYHESSGPVQDEGIGAELIRIIRQIHQARKNIAVIEQHLLGLRASEIAQLREDAEHASQAGRDILSELATTVRTQIAQRMTQYEAVAQELKDYA